MDDRTIGLLYFVLIVIQIFITIYCVNKARMLNRSKWGWGLFGFFFPIIAVIWIQFIKPRFIWDNNPDVNQKEFVETNPPFQKVNYNNKEFSFWFGLIFLMIGIILMIAKIFPRFELGDYFLPIILIGIGIGLIIRRKNFNNTGL